MSLPTQAQLAQRLRALPALAALLARGADRLPGLYLVGGAVRDLLLGGTPVDLDLVYEGDTADLRASLGERVAAHERFGTATLSAGGFVYDVARSRRERYPAPGALPEVEPAPLQEDLSRRDFTVNAIAISLWEKELGRLQCAPGAEADLEQRLLRVLHERSFLDDPTRLLRMARYRGRLGFQVEPETRVLAEEANRSRALETVSGARVGAEIRLLAAEQAPVRAFGSLRELELDIALDPEFGLRDPALAQRALLLLPAGARRDLLVLAVAGLAMRASALAELLERLSFQAPDRDRIVAAASRGRHLAHALSTVQRPSEIALAVGDGQPELVALAGALGAEEAAREWLQRLHAVALEIRGSDLVAAGVPEGPAVGRGLRAALLAKLDGEARGRAAELQVALAAAAPSNAAPRG